MHEKTMHVIAIEYYCVVEFLRKWNYKKMRDNIL